MQSHDRVCMYQNPQKEKINVVFTQNGARMREALTDTEKKKKRTPSLNINAIYVLQTAGSYQV